MCSTAKLSAWKPNCCPAARDSTSWCRPTSSRQADQGRASIPLDRSKLKKLGTTLRPDSAKGPGVTIDPGQPVRLPYLWHYGHRYNEAQGQGRARTMTPAVDSQDLVIKTRIRQSSPPAALPSWACAQPESPFPLRCLCRLDFQ